MHLVFKLSKVYFFRHLLLLAILLTHVSNAANDLLEVARAERAALFDCESCDGDVFAESRSEGSQNVWCMVVSFVSMQLSTTAVDRRSRYTRPTTKEDDWMTRSTRMSCFVLTGPISDQWLVGVFLPQAHAE